MAKYTPQCQHTVLPELYNGDLGRCRDFVQVCEVYFALFPELIPGQNVTRIDSSAHREGARLGYSDLAEWEQRHTQS